MNWLIWVGCTIENPLLLLSFANLLGTTSGDSQSLTTTHRACDNVAKEENVVCHICSPTLIAYFNIVNTTNIRFLLNTAWCCWLSVLGPMTSAGSGSLFIPLLCEFSAMVCNSETIWRGASGGTWEELMLSIGTMELFVVMIAWDSLHFRLKNLVIPSKEFCV